MPVLKPEYGPTLWALLAGRHLALRVAAIQTLVEEETRLGMLVGVSVGFELARELAARRHDKGGGGEG